MPHWKQIVREHLAALRLPPEREIEIVEQPALHLEAVCQPTRRPQAPGNSRPRLLTRYTLLRNMWL